MKVHIKGFSMSNTDVESPFSALFSYGLLLLFQTAAPRLLALEGMLFRIIKRYKQTSLKQNYTMFIDLVLTY